MARRRKIDEQQRATTGYRVPSRRLVKKRETRLTASRRVDNCYVGQRMRRWST
jgi:hypothetical protein